MKQDEIIEMARQAGIHGDAYLLYQHRLEAFVKLVEERTAAKEREACAKTCVELPSALEEYGALNRAAAAILARGQT